MGFEEGLVEAFAKIVGDPFFKRLRFRSLPHGLQLSPGAVQHCQSTGKDSQIGESVGKGERIVKKFTLVVDA